MSRRPSPRPALRLAAILAGALAVLTLTAPAASAHPLGNFTVNYYEGLRLTTAQLGVRTIIDAAELPTYQSIEPAVDTDSDHRYAAAEKAAYSTRRCASLAAGLRLTANGQRVALRSNAGTLEFLPSPAIRGLFTTRISCDLTAPLTVSRRVLITFSDHMDDRYGWHEITATGDGVHVENSATGTTSNAVAAASISDELRHYPNNLLSSPLDIRDVRLTAVPGTGAAAAGRYAVSGSNLLLRALQPLTNAFYRTASTRNLTLPVGLLAVALAIALGCGHAALPGHGKTVMAAYLVGRGGSLRDAVIVGATVTLTHTAGVLLLGLAVTLSAQFMGTTILRYLGVLSGATIAAVGVALLRSARRGRRAVAIPDRTVTAPTDAPPALVTAGSPRTPAPAELAPEHRHGHPHPHDHDQPYGHDHGHGPLFSRKGLVGIGVAGGLVPSPSALVVLLSAVALGRTLFGVALVLGYGFGMAATLMLAGFLLVRLRHRLGRLAHSARPRTAQRYLRAVPVLTALLVLAVGLGLAFRALGSPA